MGGGRRARRAGLVVLSAAAVVVLVSVVGPPLLGRLGLFRVRQVELIGVRHLAPDTLLGALRLPPEASVFADTDLLADRVKGLRGVADARVARRLPGALTVLVREVEPVALVLDQRGAVTVVDAHGDALPFDPARSGLDLPVAASADSAVAGALAMIQAVDAALFREVTAARALPRGDVLLELGSRRVLLGRDAGPEVIRAVVLVAQDLAATGRPYRELDARYAGQVVVRRRATTT